MSKKLKMIGMTVFAVCAFLAVSASAAMATPNFTIAGAIPTETAQLTVVNGSTTTSTLEVPGLLKLKGTGIAVEGASILGEKTDTVEHIIFTGVTVEAAEEVCQANSPGAAAGTIKTNPLASELVTIGTIAYDTFKPETAGGPFVEVVISAKTGKSCPLSGTYKILGSINGTVPASGTQATTQKLTFTKADEEATKATDKLTFGPGAIESFLTTTVELKLCSDKIWGVDW